MVICEMVLEDWDEGHKKFCRYVTLLKDEIVKGV